jgi:hypothetical protein
MLVALINAKFLDQGPHVFLKRVRCLGNCIGGETLRQSNVRLRQLLIQNIRVRDILYEEIITDL